MLSIVHFILCISRSSITLDIHWICVAASFFTMLFHYLLNSKWIAFAIHVYFFKKEFLFQYWSVHTYTYSEMSELLKLGCMLPEAYNCFEKLSTDGIVLNIFSRAKIRKFAVCIWIVRGFWVLYIISTISRYEYRIETQQRRQQQR